MKKRIKGKKLGRTTNERKQLFRNLIRGLLQHGFVVTSEAKAKAIQPLVEKLVTASKTNAVASLRRLIQKIGDVASARTLLTVGTQFAKRPGGYTRILKLGTQPGDSTRLVRLEWIEKIEKPQPTTAVEKTPPLENQTRITPRTKPSQRKKQQKV